MEPETERFFDEVADLAVDGFTAGETLSIASILRTELKKTATRIEDVSPVAVLMAVLKLEATAAAQKIITTDPVKEASRIAALQAKIAAFAEMDAFLTRVRDAGEAIWSIMEERDRQEVARIMGLEYGDETDATAQGYDT